MGRITAGLLAAALASAGLAACEPAPPRLVLVVTTDDDGGDSDPGDGVCASDEADGACTLRAAFDEGNLAEGGADLTVPTGAYPVGSLGVDGDIRVNHGAPTGADLPSVDIRVANGGRLELTGIGTVPTNGFASVDLVVGANSSASLVRSALNTVRVESGGGLVMSSSAAQAVGIAGVANGGSFAAVGSSLLTFSLFGGDTPPLSTAAGGRTRLGSTVVAQPAAVAGGNPTDSGDGTCSGVPPESVGYVHVEVPCGSVVAPGDGSGPALLTMDFDAPVPWRIELDAESPLVDAIPLGGPACDPTSVDLYGNPRGVDGNGDGVGGCDIGAIERQPDAA